MSKVESAESQSNRFYLRLGFGTVGAVIIGFLFWSLIAPLDGAVVATGKIVVEGNRKVIQHLEGGIIGEIEVSEGDTVAAGEIVASLEDTLQQANVALIRNQLMALYAKRARLEAERDSTISIRKPYGAKGILILPLFDSVISGQTDLFNARKNSFETQQALLQERIVQQQERIAGLKSQRNSLREQRILINDELDSIRKLHIEGYAPTTQLRKIEREAKSIAGNAGAIAASIAEAESGVVEARLEVERLVAERREEAIAELRNVDADIAKYEERHVSALDALRRTEIRSPLAGRVLSLSINTVGGVISPGSPLMEIVPDESRLQIEVLIVPRDVDSVFPGQETLIRFTALGGGRSPEALGLVKSVSADVIEDDLSGASYFSVLIELQDEQVINNFVYSDRLVPGMPVEAFIRTGSRPAISYFLKPLTDAFARSLRED